MDAGLHHRAIDVRNNIERRRILSRHGGKIALLGILPKNAGIDWNQVIFKGLMLKGIYGREMYETWYKMKAMVQSGLDMLPVVTHKFRAEDYQLAFDVMKSGNSGKVILEWD